MFSLPHNACVVCFVVRHGRTVLNHQNAFRGNVDPPLDDVGIKQAEELKKLFADEPVCAIFVSDKQRAHKTAEIIAQSRGLPIHESSNINALDVGKFSGQKRTKENIVALQHFLENPDHQIPGGESLNEFRARIDPSIHEAVCLGMKTGVSPIIVAHSSVVREVGNLIYGDHKKVLVEPGGAVAIYIQDGKYEAKPIFRPMLEKKKADTIS